MLVTGVCKVLARAVPLSHLTRPVPLEVDVIAAILHLRRGVSEHVAHWLIVLYLVRGPDYLSHLTRMGGTRLAGREGHAQRQRSQSKLSWFTLRASAGPGQGPRLHSG